MGSKPHHRAFGRRLDQLTVAVVDNRPPMASMMRAMLAAIGAGQIETYEDPANAFAAMMRTAPDLVIAAGAMQPFGGVELIRAMRQADRTPLCFVPAMVMSAYAKPNLVAEALRAGAHQVLMLPTSASTVYRRLDWLVNDDRPFELIGKGQGKGHYVVSGVEERLALAVPRPAVAPAAAHAVKRRAVNE